MKKRLMALLLLTGLLSAALTGCGGGSTEQASEDGQTADGSTEARAQANEIVVGIAQDLDESLDPHLAVAAGTKEVMFNVFEGLVKPTPDGDLVPAVADHYEISEDQTTYTFTLREGVQFHNGDPVEMRDVTYSIERCADDSEGTPLIPALSAISSIQADDTTLTITLDQPDSEFLSYLTLAILPEDYTCFALQLDNLTEMSRRFGYHVGDGILKDFSGLLQLMGDTDGTVGYNGAGKFLAFFDECSTRKAEVMIHILQSQVDEYNKLNPEYPILFTAAWATTSEEELYHVRDLVRCAQKKMSLIAEEGGAVLAGTERGEA